MASTDRPRSGPLSLGDRLLAFHHLRPGDAETREAILALLGLERAADLPDNAVLGPWAENVERPPVDETPLPPVAPPQENEGPGRGNEPSSQRLDGPAAATRPLGRMAFERPEWAGAGDAFRPAAGRADSVAPPPLFEDGHARAILGAMLATWREGTEFDIDRAIRTLTSRRRLDRLPYRPTATVSAGVQVLIDVSPAMHPFRQDIAQLLVQLDRLCARGHASILEFARRPSRGVRAWGALVKREPWRPPGAGAAVVVVSEFGIVAPLDNVPDVDAEEWRVFAERIAAAGCDPVALVPFAPERWPSVLTRTMRCVHWSERTTARQVVRALRDRRPRGDARL